MRAGVDEPPGAGASLGLRHGVVAVGGDLPRPPATAADAVAAVTATHGDRVGRRLERFVALEDGTFVWTRDRDGAWWPGRITGPWRWQVLVPGLPHVRTTAWSQRPVSDDEVPTAVARSFARGGRAFQSIRAADPARTAKLWQVASS